jgi:hypothetical protein
MLVYTFLLRLFAKNILSVGSEIGRLPPQFGDASKVASAIMNSGFEYDSGKLVFNKFRYAGAFSSAHLSCSDPVFKFLDLLCHTRPMRYPSSLPMQSMELTKCLGTIPLIMT